MLEIRHISKTFNPGTVNEKRALNDLSLTLEDGDYELYLIDGGTPDDIITWFRELIGPSYLPPKWAFGFGQSRWSYASSEEVRKVAARYRENHIPLTAFILISIIWNDTRTSPSTGRPFPILNSWRRI